ncbi:hypothetical protein PHELEMICH_12 [Mycobacterium phage Phelemich]|uniref:DUF7196 domain-containing protein n=2 Tax=Acadianvirus reprobate TaxID=1982903 RepID=S5Z8W8_9CAUD|nr:hypothetical protein N847_gp12 [Mycobacterium phage Phelemich]YP_008409933.1 hypothetical protein REPROBATE_12 [Mycobacterium phage Reprobate]AGT12748.1 hypothetical protein REPROBATE_12 [Mycobacterium phage Reprobate]AGT13926.1 hypothetical protein PHELEMICH_12 [Mycobacterium phage Phelemich]
MGCRCGGGAGSGASTSDIIGYRAYLPDGTILPPVDEPPFFQYREAHTEVLLAGGGTTRAIRRAGDVAEDAPA